MTPADYTAARATLRDGSASREQKLEAALAIMADGGQSLDPEDRHEHFLEAMECADRIRQEQALVVAEAEVWLDEATEAVRCGDRSATGRALDLMKRVVELQGLLRAPK